MSASRSSREPKGAAFLVEGELHGGDEELSHLVIGGLPGKALDIGVEGAGGSDRGRGSTTSFTLVISPLESEESE